MELLLIIGGIALFVYLAKLNGRNDRSHTTTQRDSRPLRETVRASQRRSTKAPPRTWTDRTPTPAGARAQLTPKQQRTHALVKEARCAGGYQLKGRAWVIDGDTIVIQKQHIRLAGIDAPELGHPYGKMSRSALINLCNGRTVTAEIKPELSHERVVAICRLDDGTDLAEALVREGLALDWPSFSGGRYGRFEPRGVRKKLWKTAMRQGRAKSA